MASSIGRSQPHGPAQGAVIGPVLGAAWSAARGLRRGAALSFGLWAMALVLAPSVSLAGAGVRFITENDFYTHIQGEVTDRYYSSSLILSYARNGADTSRFARRLADRLFGPEEDQPGAPPRYIDEAFGVSHAFFTPENLRIAEPQPLDHPYGGLLRGTYDLTIRHNGMIDSVQMSLGMAGPASAARQVQIFWHDFIDDVDPQGWANQVENEPVLQGTWQRKWDRFILVDDADVLNARVESDLRPVSQVSIGNAFLNGSIGIEWRIGNDLARGFGAPRIGPDAPSTGYLELTDRLISWYAFAAADIRATGRNLFIQGNTFRDSLGRDIEHFTNDLRAGVAVQVRSLEISYAFVSRSEEFDTQDGRHNFGFIGIATSF